jgi:hypothetical protein
MNIANNILKHSLQNELFRISAKEMAEKAKRYGLSTRRTNQTFDG